MSTTKFDNRKQLLTLLGAEQKNVQWSWCAVDHRNKRVFFSVWDYEQLNKNKPKDYFIYMVQQPWWGINESTGNNTASRNDHDEKIGLYFNEGYSAYCYILKRKKVDGEYPAGEVIIDGVYNYIFRLELIVVPTSDTEKGMPKEDTIIGITKYRIERQQFSRFKKGEIE